MRALHGVLPAALLVLLAAAGGALAQDEAPDEDPFEDEGSLFEDEEADPFAELEQRASLDEEGTGDEDGAESGNEEDGGEEETEEADRVPAPLGAALVGLALAAGTLDRLRSRT